LGTSDLVGGAASLSVNNLSLGNHTYTAVYKGDSSNAGSTSAPLKQTVKQAASTTTLKSSANPASSGQSVTLTADITPSSATGSVSFKDGTTMLGSGDLSAGTASVSVSTLAVGAHSITADYAGDAGNAGSTSTALKQTVIQGTKTDLRVSPNPSSLGQSISLKSTVTPATASGKVTFMDGTATLGTISLSNGIASLDLSTLGTGSHTLTASYGGDASDGGSVSAPVTQTVSQASTTTTLTRSPVELAPGQKVTLTAAVSPATAAGSVTFLEGSVSLGTGMLKSGIATLAVSTLSSGSHSLSAVYAGDSNNAGSTSAAVMVKVSQTTTAISISSSVNPSNAGQITTLTATVTPSSATGSVSFKDGAFTMTTGTLKSGIATYAAGGMSPGAHTLTAVYEGDAINLASTSSPLTQTINPASTTTALTSSANPSVAGRNAVLTASVFPASATGNVTFKDGATKIGSDGLINGKAEGYFTLSPIGQHSLTASYEGDPNFAPSTSPVLVQVVNPASTTTALSSSLNPAQYGQTLNLTATVSPQSATGNVTFRFGSNPLGTAPLNGGTANYAVSVLPAGSLSLTAAYDGDSLNAASTSPELTQTINQAPTTVTLASSANPSPPAQPVILTATVTPSNAIGNVTFVEDSTQLGTGLLNGGKASVTVNSLASGVHRLTAVYAGDSNDAAGTSAAMDQLMNGIYPTGNCIASFSSVIGQVAPSPVVCKFLASDLPGEFTVTTTASWLHVSPSSGTLNTSAQDFTITVDPSGLAAGSYAGAFTISGPKLGSFPIAAQLDVSQPTPPGTITASPYAFNFDYRQGSPLPLSQTLTISSTNGSRLPFALDTNGATWLNTSVRSGITPQQVTLTVDTTQVQPGSYWTTLALASVDSQGVSLPVAFTVSSAAPPQLTLSTPQLTLLGLQGGAPVSGQVPVSNGGGDVLNFTATSSGGDWLRVAPTSGSIDSTISTAPVPVVVTADPSTLNPGTYNGLVSITTDNGASSIPVVFTVASQQPIILVSQTALSFTAVTQGGISLPQQISILNVGAGTMDWTATASTLSGGKWLVVASSGGTVEQGSAQEDVSIDPAVASGLTPGEYFGQITIAGPAVTPQFVTVKLTVQQSADDSGPDVSPASLIFLGFAGRSTAAQTVTIGVQKPAGDQYISSASGGFSYSPVSATLQPNEPATLQVNADFSAMNPGDIERGSITLQFFDGTTRTIDVLKLAIPPMSTVLNCSMLNVQWRQPAPALFKAVDGYGQTLELEIADNCGRPFVPGIIPGAIAIVQATFSNNDPPVTLAHIGNGVWTGSWTPMNPSSESSNPFGIPIVVTVAASNTDSAGQILQSGQASPLTAFVSGSSTPTVASSGVQQSVTTMFGQGNTPGILGPVAPGALIILEGKRLAAADTTGPALPLPTSWNGVQAFLGSQALPLVYAGPDQVNVQIPFDVPVNTHLPLTIQRDGGWSVPVQLPVASAQPGILTSDGSLNGVSAGDGVTLYCTGLGAVSPPVPAGAPSPTGSPSVPVNAVSVTIGGQDARVLSAFLSAVQPGVYLVLAVVPAGVSGTSVPVVVTVAGQSSAAAMMAVQ